VGELLDRRASTAARDAAGATPLLLAARGGCLGAARLLLSPARNRDPRRGEALGMRDAEGMTPLLGRRGSLGVGGVWGLITWPACCGVLSAVPI
jgi:hypothetical protein